MVIVRESPVVRGDHKELIDKDLGEQTDEGEDSWSQKEGGNAGYVLWLEFFVHERQP